MNGEENIKYLYDWCPECNKTSRYSREENGDFKPEYDFSCLCPSVNYISWALLRLFYPSLPSEPEENTIHRLEEKHIPLTLNLLDFLNYAGYEFIH